DDEFVLVREGVGDRNVEIAGVTFLAVRAAVEKPERSGAGGLHGPDALVETDAPAMQMVGTVGQGELPRAVGQLEATRGDATGDAADDRAKIGMAGKISIKVIETEDDVDNRAVTVRHAECGDDAAVGNDVRRSADGVA